MIFLNVVHSASQFLKKLRVLVRFTLLLLRRVCELFIFVFFRYMPDVFNTYYYSSDIDTVTCGMSISVTSVHV